MHHVFKELMPFKPLLLEENTTLQQRSFSYFTPFFFFVVPIQQPVSNSELISPFIFSPAGFYEHGNTYRDFYFKNYLIESGKKPSKQMKIQIPADILINVPDNCKT